MIKILVFVFVFVFFGGGGGGVGGEAGHFLGGKLLPLKYHR